MLNRRQFMGTGIGAVLGFATARAVAQEAAELQINSSRYISINAETGAIFAQRDAHKQVAIASLTKIFTAMEAVSIAPLDTVITTTSDDMQSADATVMGFGPGESFTLEELVYGMLLPSGNDAAHAIARTLGAHEGDDAETAVNRFMDLVNQRVADMGLQNTHLINPDGWGVDGHYSSAADVAAMMAYASQNEFVLGVMGTRTFTTNNGYTVTNTNKVLTSSPSVLGGKTGYDDDAGWCLVQIAERNDTRIIAVTLDGIAPDDWYNDNLVLLDFGFEQQIALGSNDFDGEKVAWANPDAAAFSESGKEASIIGKSTSGTNVAQHTEPIKPQTQTTSPQEVTRPPTQTLGKAEHSSGLLAGVGTAVLSGVLATRRWRDFGGNSSSASLLGGAAAISHSVRRGAPILERFIGTQPQQSVHTDHPLPELPLLPAALASEDDLQNDEIFDPVSGEPSQF